MPNIITPEAIGSYPHLFKPMMNKEKRKKNPDTRPEYSVSLLFTQAAIDSADGKTMNEALIAECIAKWGKTGFETMLKEGTFESPWRKDISSKGYPPEIVRYISCSSGEDYPPAVVSLEAGPDGKPKRITEPREFYPGVRLRASVSIRLYGGPGTTYKPGGKFDLRNVQKLGDGPRIADGGSSNPEDDFGPGVAPAVVDDAAALAALMG